MKCRPNSFLACNQMKALILEKSSIFPLSLSGIGLMENTTKATSLAIQNCWNVYKGDSWRTKVPTPLSENYRYVPTQFSIRLLHTITKVSHTYNYSCHSMLPNSFNPVPFSFDRDKITIKYYITKKDQKHRFCNLLDIRMKILDKRKQPK